MSTPAAYIAVIAIWATTPIAIKFSSEGVSFYDAVALRMLIAAPSALLLVQLLQVPFRWKGDWRGYAAGALGIYGGLLPVYFAAQYIPSGLISVLWGLAPIVSSVAAARWLDEQRLTLGKFAALLTAMGGLALVFRGEVNATSDAAKALLAVLASVFIFVASALLVKRRATSVHPLAQTAGTLIIALPCFLLTWTIKDGSPPDRIGTSALFATLYLALFGSVLSWVLYYYILQRLPLTRVALTTLVSPVIALGLGTALAGETLTTSAMAGSALIICALAAFQWEDRLRGWLQARG
jgi:drug/metabolite transporter (DMT)-like permease